MLLCPCADGPEKGQNHEFADFRPQEINGVEYTLVTYATGIMIGENYYRAYIDVGFSGESPEALPSDVPLCLATYEIDKTLFRREDFYKLSEEEGGIKVSRSFVEEEDDVSLEPTKKSPEVNKVLNAISGDNREAAISLGFCIAPPIGCGKAIKGFKDGRSREDYRVSGLCQECQDTFYNEEE